MDITSNVKNPSDWSGRRKWFHLLLAAFACFVTVLDSSIIESAAENLNNEFNVSSTASALPVSLYTLGLAFGPAIAAPISEMHGRLVVYRVSLATTLCLTIGAAISKAFDTLLVFRSLGGIFSGPCLSAWGALSSDLASSRERLVPIMAVMVPCSFLGIPSGT